MPRWCNNRSYHEIHISNRFCGGWAAHRRLHPPFLPELPSRAAQEAFSHRDVKLDGKRVKPDVRVHAGQCVEVFCMEQTAPLLDVVYEDADVLLVNKRAGISVEADERGGVTLTELAARTFVSKLPTRLRPRRAIGWTTRRAGC